MVFIFDYDFDTFFDWFSLDFSSIFGPRETSKIGVATAREHDFHIFEDTFRAPKWPQNDPQKDPQKDPQTIQKFIMFPSFCIPGPLMEPPGAILDAFRALRDFFRSSLKLLHHCKIDFLMLLGDLGILLGPQERPKTPKWPQNVPTLSQNDSKIIAKCFQNASKILPKLFKNNS